MATPMDVVDRVAIEGRFLHSIPSEPAASVILQAVSAGERKARGIGLFLNWGVGSGPLGCCGIGWNDRGICRLSFGKDSSTIADELVADWPLAEIRQRDRAAAALLKRIFCGDLAEGAPVNIWVCATPFQLSVWRALLRIPEGFVASYRAVACAVGSPNAARAVGSACRANPVAYLVPCHRVVHSCGDMNGFRWGDALKREMLLREYQRKCSLA